MQIPPVSGPNYTQGPTEDPSSVYTYLRNTWLSDPNIYTAERLRQHIRQYYPELKRIADDKARWLDAQKLPFSGVAFETAYEHVIDLLQNWIDGGGDKTNFAEIKAKFMEFDNWVSRELYGK